jgi:hypothetical protein
MAILYLFTLINIEEKTIKNVAVLSNNNNSIYSQIRIGMKTNIFSKSLDSVECVDIVSVFNHYLYNDVKSKISNKNYKKSAHKKNEEYYITVDNYIWRTNLFHNVKKKIDNNYMEYNNLIVI